MKTLDPELERVLRILVKAQTALKENYLNFDQELFNDIVERIPFFEIPQVEKIVEEYENALK